MVIHTYLQFVINTLRRSDFESLRKEKGRVDYKKEDNRGGRREERFKSRGENQTEQPRWREERKVHGQNVMEKEGVEIGSRENQIFTQREMRSTECRPKSERKRSRSSSFKETVNCVCGNRALDCVMLGC